MRTYLNTRRVVSAVLWALTYWDCSTGACSSDGLPRRSAVYPPLARAANISGVLHVVITTDGHRVVTAHTRRETKYLRDAAEKNAMSWQFTTHEPTTFTVTYVYKLVDDRNCSQTIRE